MRNLKLDQMLRVSAKSWLMPASRLKAQGSRQLPSAYSLEPRAKEVLELIGNTPLLSLSKIEQDVPGVRLFAKAEWFNPGGSVKDRAAASIIADAESSGRLRQHVALLDASSGNTAVAYAMIAAAKGYRATLCVPKKRQSESPRVVARL